MRTFQFFKQLDPAIDPIAGLLFQEEVIVHGTRPRNKLETPWAVWDAGVRLARSAPGRLFKVFEQGKVHAAFEAEPSSSDFESTHTLRYDHWKHGPAVREVKAVNGRSKHWQDRASVFYISNSREVHRVGRVIDGKITYHAAFQIGWAGNLDPHRGKLNSSLER